MSADDNVDEILEEFETDPEQFVELTDELRDRFFTKMLTARPSNRSRLLTLLTEIRNDEDIVATKGTATASRLAVAVDVGEILNQSSLPRPFYVDVAVVVDE